MAPLFLADYIYMKTISIFLALCIPFYGHLSLCQESEISALQAKVENNPLDFDSVSRLVRLFINHQNYQSAQTLLRDYLDVDSANAVALYLYATVMNQSENIPEAIVYYQRAINHDSTLGTAYRDLALLYDIFSDYESMNRYMRTALELSQTPESLYYDFGYSFDMLDRTDSALIYYHRAIVFDTLDCQAYLNIGAVKAIQGDLDSAKIYTRRSLDINPDSPEACYNYAEIFASSGSIHEAVVYFRKSLALDSGLFGARKRLGELYEVMGDSAMAKIYFEEFLESSPVIYADDIKEVREKLSGYR